MKIEKLFGFHWIHYLVLRASYMLFQNNCINNGVTNGLKQKKKKHSKQLDMVKQKRGERRGNDTKHTVTTQNKTKVHKVPIDEGKAGA